MSQIYEQTSEGVAVSSDSRFGVPTTFASLHWEHKGVILVAAYSALCFLIFLPLGIVSLVRSRGRRPAFVALIVAITCFLTYYTLVFTSYITDLTLSRDLPRRQIVRRDLNAADRVFVAAGNASMLAAVAIVLHQRRDALQTMLRAQGEKIIFNATVAKVKTIVFGLALAIIAVLGLVATILSVIPMRFDLMNVWNAFSQVDAIEGLGVASLLVSFAIYIYLTVAVAQLRKEIAAGSQQDKPTNTVAFVIIPTLWVQWAACVAILIIVPPFISQYSGDRTNRAALLARTIVTSTGHLIVVELLIRLGLKPKNWETFEAA